MYSMLAAAGLNWEAEYVTMGVITAVIAVALCIGKLPLKIKLAANTSEENQDVWDDVEFESSGVYSFTDETAKKNDFLSNDRTVILSGMDGTVRLISLNKNVAADLVLTRFPCMVGSQEAEVQVAIPAVGVSRRHAVFEKMEDGIYLTDLNSTNGTKVNGEKLKKEEKKKLLVEDIIEFADVRYMYCGGGDMRD